MMIPITMLAITPGFRLFDLAAEVIVVGGVKTAVFDAELPIPDVEVPLLDTPEVVCKVLAVEFGELDDADVTVAKLTDMSAATMD
jgi:hypothetical protein